MLTDFVRAWNQGNNPDLYEIENAAMDREETVWDALNDVAPWAGRTLLDLGCGTGFWLPRYAIQAREVIGVEPDVDLLERARSRTPAALVLHGSAEHIPLANASVDVVHARFAYFFPTPGNDCSAGLSEVMRVLRPGGTLVVIDNDQVNGEFAELLALSSAGEAQGYEDHIREWWSSQGAHTTAVMSSWEFNTPHDLRAVISMEFPDGIAQTWLNADPERRELSYGYLLHHIGRPVGRDGMS